MPSIWFIVPAHGRVEKTRVCLRQLARTCSALAESGLDAHAVVVADDENLDTARDLGLALIPRPNRPLGLRWNEGYHFAAEAGADYFVPVGSDDWIDPILFADLPDDHQIRCSRQSSVIREDGLRLARLNISYQGGDGVRILPRGLLAKVGFRPAEDARDRAIDTSIIRRLTYAQHGTPPALRYFDANPYQIVDWKTPGAQLNSYRACLAFLDGPEVDPWEALVGRYPAEALDEMRTIYRLRVEAAA